MYLSRIQLTEALLAHSNLGAILRRDSYGMHQLLWDLFQDGSRHLFREENSFKQLGTDHKRPLFYVLSSQPPKANSPLFQVDCKPFQPMLKAGQSLAFELRANPTISRHQEGKRHSSRHDVVMDAKYQHLLGECLRIGVLDERSLFTKDAAGRKRFQQNLSRPALKQALLSHEKLATAEAKAQFFQGQNEAIEQAAGEWLKKKGERSGFALESYEATGYLWHSLTKAKQHRNAGYSTLDYQGVLRITDASLFLDQLYKGFGPSKSFGCGLMMIRRL